MCCRALLFLCIALFAACGPIPTGPNDGGDPNVVYVDEDWGFRVSRPDSTWGVQSQIFAQGNGLPLVEVQLLAPVDFSIDSFRPTLYLTPNVLRAGVTQDSVVAQIEGQYQETFRGYVAEAKIPIQVDSETGVTWQFRARSSSQNLLDGTRFWVTVVAHDRAFYVMLGNGLPGTFPVADYQLVAERLVFLK